MTVKTTEKINCPNCQHEQMVDIYRTLNVTVDPDDKKRLFKGEINAFKCENCGEQIHISTPLMYHDMMLRFVVQYFPAQMLNDPKFLEQFNIEGQYKISDVPPQLLANPSAGYLANPHFVFDLNELLTYVFFRDRLVAVNSPHDD